MVKYILSLIALASIVTSSFATAKAYECNYNYQSTVNSDGVTSNLTYRYSYPNQTYYNYNTVDNYNSVNGYNYYYTNGRYYDQNNLNYNYYSYYYPVNNQVSSIDNFNDYNRYDRHRNIRVNNLNNIDRDDILRNDNDAKDRVDLIKAYRNYKRAYNDYIQAYYNYYYR